MDGRDRRDFIRLGLTGVMAAGVFARGGIPSESSAPAATPRSELEKATVAGLQDAMAKGEWTSEKLVQACIERVEAVDWAGPSLHAVVEINPDALSVARLLDAERSAGKIRGPLHGIPVLVKDNVDTADRMATTAGSLALADAPRPRRDAFVVSRMREAGAVILGKTNLSEWANFRSSHSLSGWSGRGGQTRNPHSPDRSPCGSSSGSGAAVAAALAPLAVGTETDGSIVCPSSINGVVGIKPTVGLVSRLGIIPIANSQDTAGPMARTVRDAAVLLSVMAGADPGDPATASSTARARVDYAGGLSPDALRGARVGIARNFFGFHEGVDRLMAGCVEALERAGAELVDPADVPHANDYGDDEMEVLLYEFKAGVEAYLTGRSPQMRVRSLADLIAFNESAKDIEMPLFGQDIFLKAAGKGPDTRAAYAKARKRCVRLSRREGIDSAMRKWHLDALVAPTTGPAWVIDPVNGDHFTGGCSTPAAVSGYPHVTVPGGSVAGLPVGFSFFGLPWTEKKLIGLAYAFEQATGFFRAPSFPRGAML